MSDTAVLPLAGLRVVALEQAVAGPFASRQLADMGADVIKIERPDGGDSARAYDGAVNGVSAYFAWLNRGKRSVVLDLKQERESRDLRARCWRAPTCSCTTWRRAPSSGLGFGYDDLARDNPRLVWCGISGYGPDGPLRDKKAYDMLVQAESGVVSVTGSRGLTGEGRRLDRRHRVGHVRLLVDSCRSIAARANGNR